jgi:hypothetical protein
MAPHRTISVIVDNFAHAVRAVSSLKDGALVDEYALGEAMAFTFWSEPTSTFDVDIFVLLKSEGMLVSLEPIYRWARAKGYAEEAEHIVIAGVPVQIIPAHNPLTEEAVRTAVDLDYEGHPIRVIRPEYLVAMALEPSARTKKRLMRIAALLDEGNLDLELLRNVLERYNLVLPELP